MAAHRPIKDRTFDAVAFGKTIKQMTPEYGQGTEIAKRCGLDRRSFYRITAGRVKGAPNLHTVLRLCYCLGLNPWDYFR